MTQQTIFSMKKIAQFLIINFLSFPLIFAQHGTSFSFNGAEVNAGDMQHQIICLEQGDKFTVSYSPKNPVKESQYVIGGLEFWAQLSMGKPQVIGRMNFSEPAKQPSMTFTLKDFQASASLPEESDAIRVTIRVAQVLQVQGKRMLGFEPLNEKQRSCSFSLIKKCQ